MSIEKTLEDREKRYGDFATHAMITQEIKATMSMTPKWDLLGSAKKEALEMIAHKIGRILNGDPDYKDSWHDIMGYAKLVEDSIPDHKES